MTSLSANEERLAAALLEARKTQKAVDPTTLPVPADPASAMRSLSRTVQQLDEPIAGWKVGFSPANVAFAAPLLESVTLKAPTRWVQKPGPAFRIEIEIGVRLSKDLPPRPGKPYTREEIIDAYDSVFVGVEFLSSRYTNPAQPEFLLGLADCVHNGGYVLGEEKKTKTLPGPLSGMSFRATLDGKEIFNAAPKHPQDDIILPLIGYASAPNDNLGGLKAGQIVTTGSLCGVVTTDVGGKLVVSLTGFEDLVIDLSN